jgi:peptide/nickel transport system substrate-binding protein
MMLNANRLLGVVVAAGVLLTACASFGAASQGGPAAPTRLRVAISVNPDTLDPMRQTTTTVTNIVQMVTESLTLIDQAGKLQPSLATAWQEAPDGLSWVFTLRSGISFTDGTPFDAAAVKANLDRDFDPKSVCPSCNALPKTVRSVEVVDPEHLRFTMGVPLAADVMLGLLSTGTYGIQSPRGIDRSTKGYVRQDRPVGTGPYVLRQFVDGDHVLLQRNDTYWGKRPAYEQQAITFVPDSATREALVRSGQADVVLLPPISDLPSLQKDPNVKVLLAPGDRSIFFAINTVDRQQPLLQNPQVRQALNYAVNRDAIVKSTLFGAAEPATSAMAPSIFGYCAVPNPYRYDPDLARSTLAKANASNLTVTLVAPTGRYAQDFQAAQNVANDLKAVGVTVNGPRTTPDWPTYIATVNVPPSAATADIHMLGYAPGFLDASQAMGQFDPNQVPPRGLETSYYDNPTVTGLIQKAQTETNRDARAQEYCDAQKQIWNDAPWIFLWIQKFPIIYSAHVTGVGSIPNESFNTIYAQPV